MPCNRPLESVRCHRPHDPLYTTTEGKPKLLWGKFGADTLVRYGSSCEVTTLPCGKCMECRKRYVSDYTIRTELELASRGSESGCFLTLTYRPEDLPPSGSLDREAWKGFVKRLRRDVEYRLGLQGLKYLMCGEYGERTARPHYHAILIGYGFEDVRRPIARKKTYTVYQSDTLSRLWGLGVADIAPISPKAVRYVAGYTMKKLRGDEGVEAYQGTGREAPFVLVSDGLALEWLLAHWRELYPVGVLVAPSTRRVVPIPRYFDRWCEVNHPEVWEETKAARAAVLASKDPEANNVFVREQREAAQRHRWAENARQREPEGV